MSANDGHGNVGPRTIAVPATVPQGTTLRQEFGGQQIARSAETASSALAAQARAAVEARYIVAMQKPRDMAKVRDVLLSQCERFSFADAAIYHKPVGDGIEGPSIRLAEAAARAMGNVFTDTFAIYDDAEKRIIRVSATDLEANLTFTKDVTVHKTMERSKLREGQIPISVRTNSQGRKTFTVAAETDDDILNKENALASKAMRVCLLRLIPGDLLEEAMRISYDTVEKGVTEHPEDEAKRMCDGFRSVGVTIDQLKEYLGHPALDTRGQELVLMKRLFLAIKDGEASWAEALDQKRAVESAKNETAGSPPPQPKSINDLAEKAKAQRGTVKPDHVDPASAGPRANQPMSKRPASQESEEDRRARAAAAPGPNEGPPDPTDDDLPPWMGR